ncbi:MAG: hypothetical protein M1825_002334 [Sarcosagium campestre]|nr:MAG: hypothetical protein M1825_002334 [Sarcosagium campestre]
MPLKDLLKKKHKVENEPVGIPNSPPQLDGFTFMRSDTNTQDIISPPSFAGDEATPMKSPELNAGKRGSRFRASSGASAKSNLSGVAAEKGERRLSQRLHLRSHSRNTSAGSIHVPQDLPSIEDGKGDEEAQWEQRATLLAKSAPAVDDEATDSTGSREAALAGSMAGLGIQGHEKSKGRSRSASVSDPRGDVRSPSLT